jgi:hypothetical protein
MKSTAPVGPSKMLPLALGVGLFFAVAATASAQCYGGPCQPSAHKPGQVSWFDALVSGAGWGEGPPCASCHTTTRRVERPRRTEPPRINFPQQMDQRRYLAFHGQAVRLTRGRGPLETLELRQVGRQHKAAWRWVKEALPQGPR